MNIQCSPMAAENFASGEYATVTDENRPGSEVKGYFYLFL